MSFKKIASEYFDNWNKLLESIEEIKDKQKVLENLINALQTAMVEHTKRGDVCPHTGK